MILDFDFETVIILFIQVLNMHAWCLFILIYLCIFMFVICGINQNIKTIIIIFEFSKVSFWRIDETKQVMELKQME